MFGSRCASLYIRGVPSTDVFKVLLVLLPGFVTTGIVRALSFTGEEKDFDKVVSALAYSFLNYTIFAALHFFKSSFNFLNPSAPPLSNPFDVALLGFIAIIVGLLASAYKNNDWHRWARSLHLTYRSTRLNIWHDCIIGGLDFYVVVTLEDGRRLMGWVRRWGDDIEKPSLYLVDATWLNDDDTQTPVANEGILLLAPMKIASVEWMRGEQLAKQPPDEPAKEEK